MPRKREDKVSNYHEQVRDSESTFVFRVRGDVKDFAVVLSALINDFAVQPRSRSEVGSLAFSLLARFLQAEGMGLDFTSYDTAASYIVNEGRMPEVFDVKASILRNLDEKMQERTPGAFQMKGLSALEKARAELRDSDEIDEETERLEEMIKRTAKEFSGSTSTHTASTKQDRVLRQGREPELADAEREYKQEIALLQVQAGEGEWGEERLAFERDAAMERLKEKRREINDKYPAGALPTAETTGEKGE